MNNRGSNKHKLRLSKLPDDAEIVNILPSYQMYQSTISKNLTPTTEDPRTEPPRYEPTPQLSQVLTPMLLPVTTSNSVASDTDYFQGINIEEEPDVLLSRRPMELAPIDDTVDGFTRWEDTILANLHKLKRLPSINKEILRLLMVQIHLTEEIGKVGVPPTVLDPLHLELQQGDYVNGYVTVTNTTDKQIPFDMFSVVLEGAVTFGNTQKFTILPPTRMVKFLNMFDFNASWNDGCLDRLPTENNNPHFVQGNRIDPVDGLQTLLDYRKVFEPGVTYKKFFTFRLPEKLLDLSCEHGFIKHLQLPPTLGVSKNEIISSLRQKWKLSESGTTTPTTETPPPIVKPEHHQFFKSMDHFKQDDVLHENRSRLKTTHPNDFSFTDASISYSISARIIGKAIEYEDLFVRNPFPHLIASEDEYVVANEDNCYLRAIFTTHLMLELNRLMINEEARLVYTNLVNKINEKLIRGRELSNMTQEDRTPALSNALVPTSSATELAKMQQSYYTKIRHLELPHRETRDNTYEVFLPYKKKHILGASKVVGLTTLATPRTEYHAHYVAPDNFALPDDPPADTRIVIPFELVFLYSEKSSHPPPDFRKVLVELVALTIRSKELPIPVVFHHDMLFENKSRGADNFDSVTIKRFQNHAVELSKLLKELGADALDVDRETLLDIKALANLGSKYDYLKVQGPTISTPHLATTQPSLGHIPWATESIKSTTSHGKIEETVRYTKKFDLHVDVANTIIASTGTRDFCLVPDFQYCLLARLYYLKVAVKCPNGDKLTMKVPLILQKQRQEAQT